MDSVLLNKLENRIGDNFLEDKYVIEALSEYRDINKPLAMVGDSILNFTVKDMAYQKNSDPVFIDDMRKEYADKISNQIIYNSDEECQRYLTKNKLSYAPVGDVSAEKADRIIEGMIGAVYYNKGWKEAMSFTEEVLRIREEFRNEFPDLILCSSEGRSSLLCGNVLSPSNTLI